MRKICIAIVPAILLVALLPNAVHRYIYHSIGDITFQPSVVELVAS